MTTKEQQERSVFDIGFDHDHQEFGTRLFEETCTNGKTVWNKRDNTPDTLPAGFANDLMLCSGKTTAYPAKEGVYFSPDGKNRGDLSLNLDGSVCVWNVQRKEDVLGDSIAGIKHLSDGKPSFYWKDANGKIQEIKLDNATVQGSKIVMDTQNGGQITVDKNTGKVVNETCTSEEREALRHELQKGAKLEDIAPKHPGVCRQGDAIYLGSGEDKHLLHGKNWEPDSHKAPGDGLGPARRWNDTVADEFFRSGNFDGDYEGLARTLAAAQKDLSKEDFKDFMTYIKLATSSYLTLDRGDDPLKTIVVGDQYRVENGEVVEPHRSNKQFESTESTVKQTADGVQIKDARGATWDVTLDPEKNVRAAVMHSKDGKEVIAKVEQRDGKLIYDWKGADGKWQADKDKVILERVCCKADGTLEMTARDGREFVRYASGAIVHRNTRGQVEFMEDGNSNVYHFNWSKLPAGMPSTFDKGRLQEYLCRHPYSITKVGPDTGWQEQTYTSQDIGEVITDMQWQIVKELPWNPNIFDVMSKAAAAPNAKYDCKTGDLCDPSTTAMGVALGFTPPGTPIQGTVGIAKPTQGKVELSFNPVTCDLALQGERRTIDEEVRGENTTSIYHLDGTRTVVTTKGNKETERKERDRNGQTKQTNVSPKQ